MSARVLIIDDDQTIQSLYSEYLSMEGFEIQTADDGRQGLEKIASYNPNVVLLDINMPDMDGFAVLEKLQEMEADCEVIMLTSLNSIEHAVRSIKLGAYDYLVKPHAMEEIKILIERIMRDRQLANHSKLYKLQSEEGSRVLVESVVPAVREISQLAVLAAKSDTTILITGESGTGKGVLAHWIYKNSNRAEKPFVTVNCTNLQKELLESDLFGHEKGAFTGADAKKQGRVELADGGTVFLDEIGELDQGVQAKFLRLIEQKQFERVGGVKTQSADVRVIAATNRDLGKCVEEGKFRGDLYYRLKVVELRLPPLRERKEDIPALAELFLRKFNLQFGKRIKGISAGALDAIRAYSWPGNIRELENVIQRAVLFESHETLRAECLPQDLRGSAVAVTPSAEPAQTGAVPGLEIPAGGMTLKDATNAFRKKYILEVMKGAGYNITESAKLLDIKRTYLHHLMNELDIRKTE